MHTLTTVSTEGTRDPKSCGNFSLLARKGLVLQQTLARHPPRVFSVSVDFLAVHLETVSTLTGGCPRLSCLTWPIHCCKLEFPRPHSWVWLICSGGSRNREKHSDLLVYYERLQSLHMERCEGRGTREGTGVSTSPLGAPDSANSAVQSSLNVLL